MLRHGEIVWACRTGSREARTVDGGPWHPTAGGFALPYRSGCRRRRFRCDHCEAAVGESKYGDSLAKALCWPGPRRFVGHRCRSRTKAHLSNRQDRRYRRCNPADQTGWYDALELPDDGAKPGRQQVDREQHLARPQSTAPSYGDFQALPRSEVSGKDDGRGGFVPESPPTGDHPLRRRKESNSSTGPHPAGVAD